MDNLFKVVGTWCGRPIIFKREKSKYPEQNPRSTREIRELKERRFCQARALTGSLVQTYRKNRGWLLPADVIKSMLRISIYLCKINLISVILVNTYKVFIHIYQKEKISDLYVNVNHALFKSCGNVKRGTLKSQFLRLSLARFFRDDKHAISRENLVIESLRNCDVRQVLCILTIFRRFKPKNVCILPKFSSFQSFQSEIILVKCCKEVMSLQSKFFFRIFRV